MTSGKRPNFQRLPRLRRKAVVAVVVVATTGSALVLGAGTASAASPCSFSSPVGGSQPSLLGGGFPSLAGSRSPSLPGGGFPSLPNLSGGMPSAGAGGAFGGEFCAAAQAGFDAFLKSLTGQFGSSNGSPAGPLDSASGGSQPGAGSSGTSSTSDPLQSAAGTPQTSSTDGTSSTNGTFPTDGTSTTNGTFPTDGTSTTNGTSSTDGTSTTNGTFPTDGTSTTNGTSQTDGTSSGGGTSQTVTTASAPNGVTGQVLTLVNAERQKAGCGALSVDSRLAAAAQKHTDDMAAKKYMSHTSPDGRSPADRVKAEGYSGPTGENIAQGYPTAAAVMTGWMNSAGHKANILACGSTIIGVGYNANGNYWTQDFGTGTAQ